jgi:hypothetical protein
MLTGQRSAWRRRWQRSRAMRIAVPLAIPAALALVIGVVIASSGGGATKVRESALGTCASPSVTAPGQGQAGQARDAAAQGGQPRRGRGGFGRGSGRGRGGSGQGQGSGGAGATASAAPTVTASASASAAPCPVASMTAAASPGATATAPAVNPEAGRPDLAETDPVDPAGNPISLDQTPAQAATTMNCTIIAPANPLSAQGLATPWQLGDGCSEANPNEQAFVESTILAPDGQIQVYNPLVITEGTTPAAKPVPPVIPAGSQVIINLGFNGNNLVIEGTGAVQGRCIDAFGNSIIAQTSACNAQAFFQDANAQIARGTLKVAPLGTGTDGQPCESTENFALIDQDPSDNTDSEYLLNSSGQTAQDTLANKNAMGGATLIANGSDNGLLGFFVDPALGCTPFSATDTTSANGTQSSQALDDLSSTVNDAALARQGIQASLPVNDPQLLVDGQFSIGKTNTYRMLQDEPLLPAGTNTDQNAATFCQNMVNIQPAKNQLDMAKFANFTSPVPAVGTNLATFMGARLSASFTNLNCQDFGLKNPVTLTLDGNGVATAVTYSLTPQHATVPAGGMSAGAMGRGAYDQKVPAGRRGHRENAAGM